MESLKPFARRAAIIARAGVISALTAALVVVPAVGSQADESKEATISMQLLRNTPASLSVETGTTVIWSNDEVFDYPVLDGTHHIVADDGSFESDDIAPKASFTREFLSATSVAYHCTIHPDTIKGTIEVTGPTIKPPSTQKSVEIVEPKSSDTATWGFEPGDLKVAAGTTITWRNTGAQTHTVTADDGLFDSGDLAPGGKFTYTFTKSVTLRYHCEPHPWMTGLIRVASADGKAPPPPPPAKKPTGSTTDVDPVVQPANGGSGPSTFNVHVVEGNIADPQSWGFNPASLNTREGDSVVFTNTGSITHTVTADDGSFDSGDLDVGGTFTLPLGAVGTIAYHCTPHPWMKGTIVVRPASAPAVDQPPVDGPGTSVDGGVGTGAGNDTGGEGTDGVLKTHEKSAAARNALAFSTGGFIVLLGFAIILPSLLGARRMRLQPAATGAGVVLETLEDDRELVGSGARD